MSTTDTIFGLIADLQRVRHTVEELGQSKRLARIFPGTYGDLLTKLHEASSNLADFWIEFTEWESEDI